MWVLGNPVLRSRFVTIRHEAYFGFVIGTVTANPLQSAFASMHVSLRAGMNEDDIERLFGDIYVALGYTKVAKDILGKRGGKSGIPDVRLLNSDESIQVIVELKKPSENLADHENQLFRYVRDLKARYGLLSNGADVWLYRRNGLALEPITKTTSAALGEDASAIREFVKETLEPTDFAQVRVRLLEAQQEGLVLTDVSGLPAEQFLTAFALLPESPFGELVESTQALLLELLPGSDFVGGAYEFWQKTYARELSSKELMYVDKAKAFRKPKNVKLFSETIHS